MNNSEVISILNNLASSCQQGQECFRKAAESVHNSEFKRLFNIFSQQRGQFVTELRAEVNRLGGDAAAETDTTVAGSENVVTFSGLDEASVVAECQREEESAVSAYQAALKADLPLDVQYVVKRQY